MMENVQVDEHYRGEVTEASVALAVPGATELSLDGGWRIITEWGSRSRMMYVVPQPLYKEFSASGSRRCTGAIGNLFHATAVAAILAIILHGEGILSEARSLALLTRLFVAHHLREDPL